MTVDGISVTTPPCQAALRAAAATQSTANKIFAILTLHHWWVSRLCMSQNDSRCNTLLNKDTLLKYPWLTNCPCLFLLLHVVAACFARHLRRSSTPAATPNPLEPTMTATAARLRLRCRQGRRTPYSQEPTTPANRGGCYKSWCYSHSSVGFKPYAHTGFTPIPSNMAMRRPIPTHPVEPFDSITGVDVTSLTQADQIMPLSLVPPHAVTLESSTPM
jgi:hypothetical protein